MLTIAYIAIALAIAGMLGFAVSRILNPMIQRRWLRVAISIVPGSLAFIGAGLFFLVKSFENPAADAAIFEDVTLLEIRFDEPQDQGIQTSNKVSIAYPSTVNVAKDFTVHLFVTSNAKHNENVEHTAYLSTPKSVDIRTIDTCETGTMDEYSADRTPACDGLSLEDLEFRVAWDITPSHAGEITAALQFPSMLLPVLHSWKAYVFRDAKPLFVERVLSDEPIPVGSSGIKRRTMIDVPVPLHAQRSFMRHDGISVDLSSNQLRVPISVRKTLGVSGGTYLNLSIAGTLLAGLLGAGWLWEMVPVGRKRHSLATRAQAVSVFISYRRNDCGWAANALSDALAIEFGRDNVFLDVFDIASGEDFADAITSSLRKCDVVLAIIGPNWLEGLNLRAANGVDWVAHEIGRAISLKIPVLPVLTDRASMPTVSQLPDALGSLATVNAATIHQTNFRDDVRKLVATIRNLV